MTIEKHLALEHDTWRAAGQPDGAALWYAVDESDDWLESLNEWLHRQEDVSHDYRAGG